MSFVGEQDRVRKQVALKEERREVERDLQYPMDWWYREMSLTRLSKVNHRKHVVGELRGIRVLGGDDVQTEDWTLGVFEGKLLARDISESAMCENQIRLNVLAKEAVQKMVQKDGWEISDVQRPIIGHLKKTGGGYEC